MDNIELEEAIAYLQKEGNGKFDGNDNYGKSKINYLKKLILMDNKELEKECESTIWLSAYANNNVRSDYHWQCDCCYTECGRRNEEIIYKKAYKAASCS